MAEAGEGRDSCTAVSGVDIRPAIVAVRSVVVEGTATGP